MTLLQTLSVAAECLRRPLRDPADLARLDNARSGRRSLLEAHPGNGPDTSSLRPPGRLLSPRCSPPDETANPLTREASPAHHPGWAWRLRDAQKRLLPRTRVADNIQVYGFSPPAERASERSEVSPLPSKSHAANSRPGSRKLVPHGLGGHSLPSPQTPPASLVSVADGPNELPGGVWGDANNAPSESQTKATSPRPQNRDPRGPTEHFPASPPIALAAILSRLTGARKSTPFPSCHRWGVSDIITPGSLRTYRKDVLCLTSRCRSLKSEF